MTQLVAYQTNILQPIASDENSNYTCSILVIKWFVCLFARYCKFESNNCTKPLPLHSLNTHKSMTHKPNKDSLKILINGSLDFQFDFNWLVYIFLSIGSYKIVHIFFSLVFLLCPIFMCGACIKQLCFFFLWTTNRLFRILM